ncbi:hypothetical protein FRC09_016914 [Ceratobasidium sp. 395]|nr:hypothetical protein FRC09_016914 [Ceratobasidium sp. 395]
MSPPVVVRKAEAGKDFWPQIIRVEKQNHPLHPSRSCLIALLPSLDASTQEHVDGLYQAAQEGAPISPETREIEKLGWIVPASGELVLARRADAPSDGSQDTVIGLALEQGDLNQLVPNGAQTLKEVQGHLLGPRSVRNGTAAIEKCPETSRPGHQGPRCYTVGASIETGTQRMAPAANVSQGDTHHPNAYQETLSKVVLALADLHSKAIRSTLHHADATLLAARGDYFNAPALGSTRHHLVGGMQVNVTGISTQSVNSHQALGSAAAFHTDNGDDFCALSALTNLSDVESDFALGHFFLLEYGVAFEWEPYLTVLASGRTFHVSSPPQLRPKCPVQDPAPWELRLLVISYPSFGVLSRACPTILSSNASAPIIVPASQRAHTPSALSPSHSHRSWASNGDALMSRQNQLIFLLRELLSLNQHVLSQHTPSNTESDSGEVWRPMILESDKSWASGLPYSQPEIPPPASPNLSDLIHRHRSNIPMLAAKQIGVIPGKAAQTVNSTSKTVAVKRKGISHKQQTLVKNLINQVNEPAKRPLEVETDDNDRRLRRRKAATLNQSGNDSEEESYNTSDDDSFSHADGIVTDQASRDAPDSTYKFPFLGHLTTDALIAAVLEVTSQAASMKSSGSFSLPTAKDSYHSVLELLAELLSTRNSDALFNTESSSADAVLMVPQFWEKINTLQAAVANQQFMDHRLTAAIMLATWRVWFWVENDFRLACARALSHLDYHSWVGQLARNVYDHVCYRQTTVFMRDKYLALAPMPVSLTQRSYLSGVDALCEANNIAVQLVHCWMLFPDESADMLYNTQTITLPRSQFVQLLLASTMSADILYLPSIQHAWRRLSFEVFGARGVVNLSKTVWQELGTTLRSLDFGSAASPGGALIAAHANLCAKYPSPTKFPLPVLLQIDQDVLSQCVDGVEKKLADLWTNFDSDAYMRLFSVETPSLMPTEVVLDTFTMPLRQALPGLNVNKIGTRKFSDIKLESSPP